MSNRKPASPLLLRLPPELKAWLSNYADHNSRNMTGQIIELIKAERSRAEQKGHA